MHHVENLAEADRLCRYTPLHKLPHKQMEARDMGTHLFCSLSTEACRRTVLSRQPQTLLRFLRARNGHWKIRYIRSQQRCNNAWRGGGGVLVLAVAMRDPQEFCYLAPAPLDMWGHCGRCGSTGRYKIRYCGWNLPESLRRSPEGGGDVQEDARVASCIQCGSDSADKTPSGKWLQIIYSAL